MGPDRKPGTKISRCYISSPEVSNSIEVEGDVIEQRQSKKRENGTVLNPENAESVLSSTFNFLAFCAELIHDRTLAYNPPRLLKVMTACVIDQTIIPFTSASLRHLKVLGLTFTYDLVFDAKKLALANAPDSPANTILQRGSLNPVKKHFNISVEKTLVVNVLGLTFTYDLVFDAKKLALANASDSPANTILQRGSLNPVKKHFNISKDSGCQCMIDQYLLAAVVYAQALIDGDPRLKNRLARKYLIKDPHAAVFTEVQIPHTKITCDKASFTFYGCLDYTMGFIHAKDIPSLGRGSLKLDPSNALGGILEAKSLAEMQDAVPQITMQVLTVLTLTGRTSFTAVLTNGALWRFFTAHDGGDEIRIYTSREFASGSDNGVIVELLKDMIVHPISPMIITDFNEVMTFD